MARTVLEEAMFGRTVEEVHNQIIMLTPMFSLRQDEEYLHIQLKTPFIKSQDVEMDVDGNEFRFYAKPYFLRYLVMQIHSFFRLHLSGNVVEDGRESAKFDVATGTMDISLPKETKGEEFKDLDLLTKLLTSPSQTETKKPLIEIVASRDFPPEQTMEEAGNHVGLAAKYSVEDKQPKITSSDLLFQQKLPEEPSLASAKYGFNNSYQGFGRQVAELGNDVVEMDNVDQSFPPDRRAMRLVQEDLKFDPDHYLYDVADYCTLTL